MQTINRIYLTISKCFKLIWVTVQLKKWLIDVGICQETVKLPKYLKRNQYSFTETEQCDYKVIIGNLYSENLTFLFSQFSLPDPQNWFYYRNEDASNQNQFSYKYEKDNY